MEVCENAVASVQGIPHRSDSIFIVMEVCVSRHTYFHYDENAVASVRDTLHRSDSIFTYFHYDENAVASVQGIPLNPQVNSVNFFGNEGHGNYNALLAGLKHQLAHQFMMDAEFTWAKSMDTSSAPYEEQYYPYDSSLSYGRSDYNIGKSLKIYGMWQPVIFCGGHAWPEKIAGGWSLSGILNLHRDRKSTRLL